MRSWNLTQTVLGLLWQTFHLLPFSLQGPSFLEPYLVLYFPMVSSFPARSIPIICRMGVPFLRLRYNFGYKIDEIVDLFSFSHHDSSKATRLTTHRMYQLHPFS